MEWVIGIIIVFFFVFVLSYLNSIYKLLAEIVTKIQDLEENTEKAVHEVHEAVQELHEEVEKIVDKRRNKNEDIDWLTVNDV